MASVFYIPDFVTLIIFYAQPVDTQFFFQELLLPFVLIMKPYWSQSLCSASFFFTIIL